MRTKNKSAQSLPHNIPIMYGITVIGGMLFFLPILALYFEKELFTITNVGIIFAVEALASVIFEMPTGAIADLFGRKKTIVLAHIVTLIGFTFLLIGGSMTMFILFAIFNALARSLTSGTVSAILYDSLKEKNQEDRYKKINGTYNALWPLGASLSAIAGGYMGSIDLKFPIVASFIPIIIALILSFFLKEPTYEKEEHKNILRQMKNGARHIIKNKQLLIIAVVFFIMTGLGETLHLFRPIFFEKNYIPIEYFGYITAATYGLSSLGFYLSHDISKKIGDKLSLMLATVISPILLFTATLTSGLSLIILFTLPSLGFGIKHPIFNHLINKETSSSKRATVLSINNFTAQFGVAIVSPILGYYADIFTINQAVQITAILMLSIPLILTFLSDSK